MMKKDLTMDLTCRQPCESRAEQSRAEQSRAEQSRRIPQLEGLRFLMICIIILSHFEFLRDSQLYGEFYSVHLHNPILAVDYFFMLSGFGIYLSTKRPKCSIGEAVKFAVDKSRKIYPVYIFSLILGCFGILLVSESILKAVLKIVAFGVLDLTLCQSMTGMLMFSHSINGVCWFLSSLFICYMFCPYLLKLVDSINADRKGIVLIISSFILTVFFANTGYYIDSLELLNGKLNDLGYGHPFTRLGYVLLGMIVGKIYRLHRSSSKYSVLVATLLGLVWFLFRNQFTGLGFIRLAADVSMCMLVLYAFACGTGAIVRLVSNYRMIYLGKISMYLFLLHYPVRNIVGWIFEEKDIFLVSTDITNIFRISIIIVATIGVIKFWSGFKSLCLKKANEI